MQRIPNKGIKQNTEFIKNKYNINNNTVENILYNNKSFYQKTNVESEKVLVVLPCNAGARFGNYFLGGTHHQNNWLTADNILKKLRLDTIYMAALSSVNYHFIDDDGALVFEHEMHRVSSDGDFGLPNISRFNIINQTKYDFDINFLVKNVEIGLHRAFDIYKFQRIIFILTPMAYKIAVNIAVTNTNNWDKVTFFDVNSMGGMGYYTKMVNILHKESYKDCGRFEYPYLHYRDIGLNLPQEYKYETINWKQDDLSMCVLYNIHTKTYKQFPILKADADLSNTDIMLLYNIPYLDYQIKFKYDITKKIENINNIINTNTSHINDLFN